MMAAEHANVFLPLSNVRSETEQNFYFLFFFLRFSFEAA